MSVLGAQLDDLTGLAGQLTTTEGEIGGVATDSTSTTTNVVGDVTNAANAALTRITSLMDELRRTVDTAARNADAAAWTGANRDRFISGYADFNAAVAQAEAVTRDTFANFDAAIASMAGELEQYQASLTGALSDAQASTNSMARAVEAQRDNLDSVMNSGLSFG